MDQRDRYSVNLRRARQDAGISQEELAERCEIHRTEVSLLERAGREPRLATIVKLAGALKTTPAQLCEGISYVPKTHRFDVKKPPKQ